MLIILSGLPGTGKTTLARELAHQLAAVYLRIDTIEQAVRDSAAFVGSVQDAGYRVGYAIAEDNLLLGRTVVADSVNPLQITRDAWRAVAVRARTKFVEVEILCSDLAEHRRRVESRRTDIPGLVQPSWQAVLKRDYQTWDRPHVTVDTSYCSIAESLAALCRGIAGAQ